jgi:DUF1009 family protein|tara:strand:- start:1384 stop:1581 length:198 start_codon:yes stop_codon:yes gene_type:complete
MDILDLIEELKKIIKTKRQDISDVILTGGVENYSNYQNLVGQLKSLDHIEQEVRDFLQKRKVNES